MHGPGKPWICCTAPEAVVRAGAPFGPPTQPGPSLARLLQWAVVPQDKLAAAVFDVRVAGLLATTPGPRNDAPFDERVQQVLQLLRQRTGLEVVFVSEFSQGRRVFTHVEQPQRTPLLSVGAGDPLEASWCARVCDGRLPELMPDAAPWIDSGEAPDPGLPIGTHLSTPLVLADGRIHGTLCCFSQGVNPRVTVEDLRKLRWTARLLAQALEQEAGQVTGPA